MKFICILIGFLFLLHPNLSKGQDYEADFQKRASQITNRLADTCAIKSLKINYFVQEFQGPGAKPDPEKHVWPVVVARLKKYGNSDTAANRLLIKYQNRRPFHFTYVGMARILCQFPEATQVVNLKEKYLQQVWNRVDSYNPWTGEGTENHISMDKTSGDLYAQNSLGNGTFPEASKRLKETKQWLKWYAKRLYQTGSSEWNSSTYESYNLVGWLNLYDFALDPEVKDIAKAVLDYYSCEIALHSSQGFTGGAESRGNITGWGSGEDYISWIWFGYQARLMGSNFWINQEYSLAIHAALSAYRPPALVLKIARKEIELPALYKNSKPDYGQNKAAFVKQFLYASQGFTLGSAMIPVAGFAGGNSQYCNWKLISYVQPAINQTAQIVTGGSRFYNGKDGKGKTPWDQYVQHKNVLIQLHKIPTNASEIINYDSLLYTIPQSGWKDKWKVDFNLRFPSDLARNNPVGFQKGSISRNISYISYPKNNPADKLVNTRLRDNIFFVELETSYLAVRSISLAQPTTPDDENASRKFISDYATIGNLCGLIIEVVNRSDYNSFTSFQDSVVSKTTLDKSQVISNRIQYKNLSGDLLDATYTENGPSPSEPLYDWGFGPTSPQVQQIAPPFLQPVWKGGAGCGTTPSLFVNGLDIGYSSTDWAVFDGPGLQVKNDKLILSDDSAGLPLFYEVDFSGELPIFSNGLLTRTNKLVRTNFEPLELFPNPTQHEVMAIAKGLHAGDLVEVQIFSLNGTLVWKDKDLKYQDDGLRIPADPLGKGVYQVILSFKKLNYSGRLILRN